MRQSISHKPRVLLFEASLSSAACRAYDAIRCDAIQFNWDLQPIEYAIIDTSIRPHSFAKPPDIPTILDLWQPQGIIIECSGRTPQIPLSAFGNIPVVLLDCHPSLCHGSAVCIHSDEQEIAFLAARELLSLNLSSYAYLPYPTNPIWSRLRGDKFRHYISTGGRPCHSLDAPEGDSSTSLHQLTAQISALDKPCGIFCANDEMARMLASVCERGDISVPNDIAIIGVDNEERLCENAQITLSSVAIDFDEIGHISAESLRALMAHRTTSPSHACGVMRLVRRQSTYRIPSRDARIIHGLELIRRQACLGITPTEVSRAIGCSRRFADARFIAVTGITVQETIIRERLAHVKDLLTNPRVVLSTIPDQCGFRSMSDLCRVFKKKTGMTLSEWRRRAHCCPNVCPRERGWYGIAVTSSSSTSTQSAQ